MPRRTPRVTTNGAMNAKYIYFVHNRPEGLICPFELLIRARMHQSSVRHCFETCAALFISVTASALSSLVVHLFGDTQLSLLSLSLSLLSLALFGSGGLLQTIVGCQNRSRQREGEDSLSGAL